MTIAELLKNGVFIDGDWVESKDQDPTGEVRLIQLADVGDGFFRNKSSRFLTMAKARELGCTFLEPGDILVARMPQPLGRACIFPGVGQMAVTAVDVCILRPNPATVNAKWLVKAINSPDFRSSMQEFIRGTTRQRISRKNLGALSLEIPALPEQAKISSTVDIINAKRKSAASSTEAAMRIAQSLKKSVLDSACSGRLTREWRESHQPARPALPQSTTKRASRLLGIDDYELNPLPDEWVWVQLNDLLPVNGIFDGPFGSNLKTSDYTESGARVIRLENIGHLHFIGSKESFVSPEKYHSLLKHAVHPGDIIFSSFVDEDIRVCVLPDTLDKQALAKADCFTLRPKDIVTPKYLAMQLASPRSYRSLVSHVHGATRPRVNTTQLRSLPIPLCSIDEQNEIVRSFDALTTISDELIAKSQLAKHRIDLTSHAILSRAFRGELLPRPGRGVIEASNGIV
jgi:type I restriction enzyme S subunit